MGRGARVASAVVVTLVLGAGGYAAGDAYDVVPGLVTLAPVPEPAAPFPTIPGAVPAPEVVPVVGTLDETTPVPTAESVTALAQGLVADPRMGASTGVVVRDVLTGQVLADVSGAAPRVPASTAKLLTALAAVTALGPDRTLPTTVVQPEPGRLVLVGGGDMMLGAGPGVPDAVSGRAGLVDLAAQVARSLRLAGVAQVRLGLDDTLFSGPTVHPGWKPADVAAGFVAPVAALAVDVAKMREGEYPPRYPDPALQAAQTFAAALVEQGIAVDGAPTRETAPTGALEVGRVESAPVREIVRYAVQVSDNAITEVLGRLVAVEHGLPGSFEGATAAVVAELGRQGLSTPGAVLADCSGLATGSALPATLLVDLVVAAAAPTNPQLLPVLLDLPISGWQGTLSDRYDDGPARGLVRAKTGSLPGVTSLAGTVQTTSGRLLAFAVLADATPPGGQPAPRAAIDAFVQQVAGLA